MTLIPKRIRVISDGRAGHENQSVGLALAIARRAGSTIETIQIPTQGWLWSRCRAAVELRDSAPDLLIGVGHETHLPMWFAARKFRAKTVVIMKPTWPYRLFDLCIMPQHDGSPRFGNGRIVRTHGALNRVPEIIPAKQSRGLILIGGPSRNHGWCGDTLVTAVEAVLKSRPELTWTISDSRRTPEGFLEELGNRKWAADIFSHANTTRDWLPRKLAAAKEVWVTEDSVSMIFEAVTAGAQTGILPLPVLKPWADPVLAVGELVREGYATDYGSWVRSGHRPPPPKPTHETGRCARIVLTQLFAVPAASLSA